MPAIDVTELTAAAAAAEATIFAAYAITLYLFAIDAARIFLCYFAHADAATL